MYAKPIRHKICIDFGVKAADGFGMFAVKAKRIFFPLRMTKFHNLLSNFLLSLMTLTLKMQSKA